MPLGMGVGLGPGHIALHGDPAPLKRGTVAPLPAIFGPCLLWPNGWMDQDATTEVDLDPCHIVVDGAQLPPERGTAPPSFWPIFLRQTVAHLSYW